LIFDERELRPESNLSLFALKLRWLEILVLSNVREHQFQRDIQAMVKSPLRIDTSRYIIPAEKSGDPIHQIGTAGDELKALGP
jgi:hypothetical protein